MDESLVPAPPAAGDSIPLPSIDRRGHSWRNLPWQDEPDVWPATPPRRPVLRRAVAAWLVVFAAASVACAVVLVLQHGALDVAEVALETVVALCALIGIGLAFTGVFLRRYDRVEALGRLLFLMFAVSAWGAVAVFVVAVVLPNWTAGLPLAPGLNVLEVIVGLGYLTLASGVWVAVNADVRERRRVRASILEVRGELDQLHARTLGIPGASLVESDGNVTRDLRREVVAEQLTAPLLQEFLAMPGVGVIHRVAFPGSPSSHVSHAVISGERIALIDSVLWEPGDYLLDRFDRVVRDGGLSESHSIRLSIALQRYLEAMPLLQMRAWVVVHPLRSEGIVLANEDDGSGVRLVTADEMMREVGDWLGEQGNTIHLYALRFLRGQRKK